MTTSRDKPERLVTIKAGDPNPGRIDRSRFGKPNPADKRGTLVALTKQGLALIDRVIDAHVTNQQAIVNGLTAREQSQLSALLAKLLKGQEAPET